jgi:type I restriction enzyme S subunit
MGLMEEAFSDSDLPYKVDLVDWSAISEEFRQIVAERKVVVQAGQAKAAQSVDTCGGTQRPRTVSG